MKKIEKMYYYFFYKIHKFIDYLSEKAGGSFWSDYKAGLAIIALEIWLLFSFINYGTVFLEWSIAFDEIWYVAIAGTICAINFYFFIYSDKWKDYFQEFEKFPKRQNMKGTWIVILITLLITGNLIFSFYLLSKSKGGNGG